MAPPGQHLPDDSETTTQGPGRVSAKFGPEVFRPVLICLSGSMKGVRRSLDAKELVIGRSSSANWRINDSSASRRHTLIVYENHENPREMPRCFLEDLESRNGTELNGEPIQGRVELAEHDRILIGSTVVGFFVRDEAELRQDESLYESATRDPLTGLYNRRQLLSHMKHHMARVERQGSRLAFLLLDLDHFKNINDRYGHDVGDEALRHVATLMGRGVRESDLLARWGGEEFALCLPDTDSEAASLLAERLRRSLESSELLVGAQRIRFTMSIGGTTYVPGDDANTLFQRADRMLYRAKEAGRNRVEYSDDTMELKRPDFE